MPLKTTTIGSYPKPACAPINDWFLANKSDEERRASKGLLSNWNPGDYETAIDEAGSLFYAGH